MILHFIIALTESTTYQVIQSIALEFSTPTFHIIWKKKIKYA